MNMHWCYEDDFPEDCVQCHCETGRDHPVSDCDGSGHD